MKKKTNMIKRNSGFLAGCVVAAGASFFAADTVMTNGLLITTPATEPSTESNTAVLAPESSETKIYETDAFTVTASGNIIKGVETEKQAQTDENGETVQTDADGNPVSGSDAEQGDAASDSGSSGDGSYDYADGSSGDGSYDGGSSGDGSYDDGSSGDGSYDDGSSGDGSYDDGSSGDGSYDDGSSGGGQSIIIYDPGNGDYTYDDTGSGGSSDGSSDSGSSGEDAYTPDDVIIQGISSRYIDESELYNYNEGQLRLIRNEIFALNGRIFNSQDLRDYFSQKSWYVPTYSPEEFDANMFYYLNDYEEANLNVILNYEAALAGN